MGLWIGKDDNGNVVGISDYKKLMDEIPNKVRAPMSILLDVNLHEEKGVHYLEHGSITNSKYQEINAVAKTLATEELKDLIGKELIKQAGSKGRGSKYELKE